MKGKYIAKHSIASNSSNTQTSLLIHSTYNRINTFTKLYYSVSFSLTTIQLCEFCFLGVFSVRDYHNITTNIMQQIQISNQKIQLETYMSLIDRRWDFLHNEKKYSHNRWNTLINSNEIDFRYFDYIWMYRSCSSFL